MYKVLVRYKSGTWVEVKASYDRDEIEGYAVTQLTNKEYMVIKVLRHHSGEPEEFQL